MNTKRKYDLDKILAEAEEDEKFSASQMNGQKPAQADIQKMVERKKQENGK